MKRLRWMALAVLALNLAACASSTIDMCDADTSPPKDGVSSPMARH